MYGYSKLRRENANFKINIKKDSKGNPIYVADPSTGSDEPITGLLQILPEGLDGYDFLGMCVEGEQTQPFPQGSLTMKTLNIIHACVLIPAGTMMGPAATPVDIISLSGIDDTCYIPANGYLVNSVVFDFSSLAPEGEGDETIIPPTVEPLNPGGEIGHVS